MSPETSFVVMLCAMVAIAVCTGFVIGRQMNPRLRRRNLPELAPGQVAAFRQPGGKQIQMVVGNVSHDLGAGETIRAELQDVESYERMFFLGATLPADAWVTEESDWP